MADSFVIHLEDDVLLHKTYFQYMKILLNMKEVNPFSVLSPYNADNSGNVDEVRKAHHYAALAPLISKSFYVDYIAKYSNENYYKNPAKFVVWLGKQYEKYWGPDGYKYKDSFTHYAQAGLINRLVDCAMIERDIYVIQPFVNRQLHIGFYGANRVLNKPIPGKTFGERVENLREIINDADKMYAMAGSKEYNDYLTWSPALETWNKTLTLV